MIYSFTPCYFAEPRKVQLMLVIYILHLYRKFRLKRFTNAVQL